MTVANVTMTVSLGLSVTENAAMVCANTDGNALETLKKYAITTQTAALSMRIMFAASEEPAMSFLTRVTRTITGCTMSATTDLTPIAEQYFHDSP